MGEQQIVQALAAHGGQLPGGGLSGILPAVGAAAVHQGAGPAGGQDHALPLPHVQHQDVQVAAVPNLPQTDGESQGQGR